MINDNLKSVSQLQFEGRISTLLFPGKELTSLSIEFHMDRLPEIHASMYLDQIECDSILTELKKYKIELIPIEKQ